MVGDEDTDIDRSRFGGLFVEDRRWPSKGALFDELNTGGVGADPDEVGTKGCDGPPDTGGVSPPVEGVKRTVRFCAACPLTPPSSLPSEPPSNSLLTQVFFSRLFPIALSVFRVGVSWSPYPKPGSPFVRSSVPGVAAVLQLPGLETSSVTVAPGRVGVLG